MAVQSVHRANGPHSSLAIAADCVCLLFIYLFEPFSGQRFHIAFEFPLHRIIIMSLLTPTEQLGVKDFLRFHLTKDAATVDDATAGAGTLHFDLARVVSRNLVRPGSFAEAVDVIVLHSSSLGALLARKAITKAMLFEYLHARRVAVTADTSKAELGERLAAHWATAFADHHTTSTTATTNDLTTPAIEATTTATTIAHRHHDGHDDQQQSAVDTDELDVIENFPIHRMARQFAAWFFAQLNAGELTAADFWSDAQMRIDVHEQAGSTRTTELANANGGHECSALLLQMRNAQQLHFNPNISHAGCQGRADRHGFVAVLVCGSLHMRSGSGGGDDDSTLTGCWDAVCGLARDPFAENRWKVRHLRLLLRTATRGGTTSSEKQLELRECGEADVQQYLEMPSSAQDLVVIEEITD